MNNRQGGRRRGRGGQQARNGQPGNPHSNSRLDNRQRGNAAQLLEKYKTLARDAQMQGDRVSTEYYLQFADHYFRVLSENRSRFEEQRPQRRDEFGGDYADEDGDQPQRAYANGSRDGAEDGWDAGEDEGEMAQPAPQQQPQRRDREPRNFEGRGDRRQGYQPRAQGAQGGGMRGVEGEPGSPAAPGNGAPPVSFVSDSAQPRIEFDRLPPSLGPVAEPVEEIAAEAPAEEAAPKRRRGRKPKAAPDAPAAAEA